MGITAPGCCLGKTCRRLAVSISAVSWATTGALGGQTSQPGPYTTAQMADDYAGLIDQTGVWGKYGWWVCRWGAPLRNNWPCGIPTRSSSLVLMCPWARCDRTAEAIFRHMATIKARLRPEEFANYIQLADLRQTKLGRRRYVRGFAGRSAAGGYRFKPAAPARVGRAS